MANGQRSCLLDDRRGAAIRCWAKPNSSGTRSMASAVEHDLPGGRGNQPRQFAITITDGARAMRRD
jgi:hypothetical protein